MCDFSGKLVAWIDRELRTMKPPTSSGMFETVQNAGGASMPMSK